MILPLNQVIVGDCVEVMRTWPADSIDLVVTSPPYWGLRDYGVETVRVWGGRPECRHEWSSQVSSFNKQGGEGKQSTNLGTLRGVDQKSDFCSKCGAWKGSLGLEPHPQMFIEHLVEVCQEVKRVLKPSGTFWLNLGDTYYGGGRSSDAHGKHTYLGSSFHSSKGNKINSGEPRGNWLQPKQKLMMPSRIAIALQHDGWILRSDVIWHKPNHMPSSVKDRLTCAYEHVFLFAKARRYYFDLDAIRKPFSEGTFLRIRQPNIMNQPGGPKTLTLRGESPESGNASRPIDMAQELSRKIASGEITGKNPGDVWEIDAPNTGARNKPPYKQNNPHLTRITEGREAGHPLGKNPGDLWRISTTPFPGAHFATFPPKLIEPIIKAGSPRWICSRCGKPRTRITEPTPAYAEKLGKSVHDHKDDLKRGMRYDKVYNAEYLTTGWSDCGCGEKWVGGIVLDPFGGSGTVGQVARRLGRRFILIEIIPEYCKMAEQRVRGKYKPVPEGVTPFTQDMEAESNG